MFLNGNHQGHGHQSSHTTARCHQHACTHNHQNGLFLHNISWWQMVSSKVQILPSTLWSPRWDYILSLPQLRCEFLLVFFFFFYFWWDPCYGQLFPVGQSMRRRKGNLGRFTRFFKLCSAPKEIFFLPSLTGRCSSLWLRKKKKKYSSSVTFKSLHPSHEIICQDN